MSWNTEAQQVVKDCEHTGNCPCRPEECEVCKGTGMAVLIEHRPLIYGESVVGATDETLHDLASLGAARRSMGREVMAAALEGGLPPCVRQAVFEGWRAT